MVEINIFELKKVKITKFESGSAKVRLTQPNGGEVDEINGITEAEHDS